MKKLLTYGILLGLLSTLGFAQRGRAAGGVGPAVGMQNTAPMARTMPNAVSTNHHGVAPNAVSSNRQAKTVAPNAVTAPNSNVPAKAPSATVAPDANRTTAPDARNVPDQVTAPDANGLGNGSRVNPN